MLVALLGSAAVSCNNKSTSDEETIQYYGVSSSSVMVSRFMLGENKNVLYNLDSVFFTIDQDRRLIYNADSLPVGTDVRKLTVKLTFPYSVRSAVFRVKGGTLQGDTSITYSSTTKDTIDFSGQVMLDITSNDGSRTATYIVKVNVHQQEPDLLSFARQWRRDLPNVNATPLQVKAVQQGNDYLCLIQDDDKYVLSSTTKLSAGTWNKKELNLPFTPDINSFAASIEALFMLDINGELFTSNDRGETWTDCGVAWTWIVGGYEDRLLGVMHEDGIYKHDEYPRASGFTPTEVPEDFPVRGSSPLITGDYRWIVNDQVQLVGGVLQNGTMTNATWGYDGTHWGRLNISTNNVLPKISDAVVIPYYTFDVDSVQRRVAVKNVTWLLMGGKLADGSLNRTTYVSRNQGMSWLKGASGLQQADYMPSFFGAQAFVQYEQLNASAQAPKRAASTNTKPVTQWECPYIYLVGGYASSGVVLNNVWRGVLNRLTYRPIF